MKEVRNLSGIYIRYKDPETGKYEPVVFEDLPTEYQKELLAKKDKEWIVDLAIELGNTINKIGDQFDLMSGTPEESTN